MPKVTKTPRNKVTGKKKCSGDCKRELSLGRFYNTNNILSGDGKASICKDCMKKMIDYNDMQTLYDILQGLDIPFYYDTWGKCKDIKPEDPWSIYIRQANSKINEFKGASWKNSSFKPEVIKEDVAERNYQASVKQIDFDLTDEIIDKWGAGYELKEYQAFERKYNFLKNN